MTKKWWVLIAVTAVLVIVAGLIVANLRLAPAPSGYSSKEAGVQYYPACGNETLEHGGRTWFPIARDDWATPTAQAAAASGGRGFSVGVPIRGLAVVAAPGPGDDVGTFYLYAGGRAYWVSDSGTIDTWLTLLPQTYNWVC